MPENIVRGLVSTIMPVYNRPNMMREAVQSVLDQDYSNKEIIIVDDGSDDKTYALCERLASEFPQEVIVIHQPNRGVAMARETARQHIRGEFVQHLDSDDLLLPRRFSIMVAALIEHPECDIAYSRTDLVTFDGKVLAKSMRGTGQAVDHIFPRMLNERWWATVSPLYRRSIIDAAGTWLNLKTCEDWEYDARLGRHNLKLLWVDKTLALKREHEEEHLSRQWLDGPSRYLWASKMLEHAHSAGMNTDDPEMIRFRAYLRLLARQYWQRNDPHWAERLYELSLNNGDDTPFNRGYYSMAKVFGSPFVNATEQLYRVMKGNN